ncbi:MAG: RNA polymerase sporulation sigma factor SigK [Lachnospiraceae bacterium]|nr:RNA polymerase sporulation sigma factor SigK [Lachnospiraceae bacterium]
MKTFQKPLSSQEEAYYIQALQDEDKEVARAAKEILIERNLRLVAHIARKYLSCGEDLEDLISIGSIGLIKAVDTFDVGKGRLATYACRCIDNELLMMMRARKKISREVSLYEPIGTDKEGNEISLMDVIESAQVDVVEQITQQDNLKKMFRLMDKCLSPREKEILILRYGMRGGKEVTQSEVGEIMGISRSYVSRIEKKALGKMRKEFERD